MAQILSFAQKGIILDSSKTKILVIKYSSGKYTNVKVSGKLALPGGKMHFGEEPDESFLREVEEETGVTFTPGPPIHIYSWTYQRNDDLQQIVAVARLGWYKSGKPKQAVKEKETTIEATSWLNVQDIVLEDFVVDERPAISKYLEYQKKNPFTSQI